MFPRWKFLAVAASLTALLVSLATPILVHQEARARYIQAGQDHAALCAIQLKSYNDVQDGLAFNLKHPNGIPGISGDQIRKSIRSEAQTVYIMQSHLSCDLPDLPTLPAHLPGE